MKQIPPRMHELASMVLRHGARRMDESGMRRPAAGLVVSDLRPHLANLMGSAGFRALLMRSLALASAEVPWLRSVAVKADGTPEGLDELEAQVGATDFFEGNVALLSVLLALLVAFVGEALTVRLIRDIWPGLSATDLVSGNGDS